MIDCVLLPSYLWCEHSHGQIGPLFSCRFHGSPDRSVTVRHSIGFTFKSLNKIYLKLQFQDTLIVIVLQLKRFHLQKCLMGIMNNTPVRNIVICCPPLRYLQENRVACEMGLYYVLHIAKLRNKNALQRLLPALGECNSSSQFYPSAACKKVGNP